MLAGTENKKIQISEGTKSPFLVTDRPELPSFTPKKAREEDDSKIAGYIVTEPVITALAAILTSYSSCETAQKAKLIFPRSIKETVPN